MSDPASEHAGFALRCAASGQILEVLHAQGVHAALSQARTFAGVLMAGSRKKGLALLHKAASHGASFGCELMVGSDTQAQAVRCSAIRLEDDQLVVGMAARGGVADPASDIEQDEVMRVVSELSMMQREVSRDRARLERDLAERQRVVAMTAHDMRNAMNTIVLNAHVLLGAAHDQLPAEDRAVLDGIVESSSSVTRLLADLMTLSQPASEHSIALAPVDVTALVEATVALMSAVARKNEISLRFDRADGLEAVPADEHAIRRVVENLVGNAIKHCPSGASVVVSLRVEDDHLVTEVADDGPGIDPRVLPKLFSAFTRIQGQRSEGSGLGLAICKQLVEAHGGWIRGRSDGRRGSTFSFGLPLAPKPVMEKR